MFTFPKAPCPSTRSNSKSAELTLGVASDLTSSSTLIAVVPTPSSSEKDDVDVVAYSKSSVRNSYKIYIKKRERKETKSDIY